MSNPSNERPWMIYGAYGFTGRLVVEEALRRGHRPILSGRNNQALVAMANELGLRAIHLSLDDQTALQNALRSSSLILNVAGPFAATGPKIIEACLATGTPYVDISGEFHHLRFIESLDEAARKAGTPLLTGAGFGVTFGDCLALHVVDRLPDATHLRLSVAGGNAQTTSAVRRTVLEVMAKGSYAVVNGKWARRPFADETWTVRDGASDLAFASAPLGELAAVRASTKLPNIVVGHPMAPGTAARVRMVSPLIQGALSLAPLRRMLSRNDGISPRAIPEPEGGWRSRLWAEASDARGQRVIACLETGEGYAATARATIVNVEALLARHLVGAFTPARAFGAEHVLKIEGVSVTDLDAPPDQLSKGGITLSDPALWRR